MYCAINCLLLFYGIQCSIFMTYSSQQNISFRHFIVVTLNVQCHMAEEQANFNFSKNLLKREAYSKQTFFGVRDMVPYCTSAY